MLSFMIVFPCHADKPEELLVPSSSNNVVVLPQYSHSKVLDLKQPLPFHFETVIASKFCVLCFAQYLWLITENQA